MNLRVVPRISFRHSLSELESSDFDEWKVPHALRNKSVIFLARDPRDTSVLLYNQRREQHRDCSFTRRFNSSIAHWDGKPICEAPTTDAIDIDDELVGASLDDCYCMPHNYTLADYIHEPNSGISLNAAYMAFFYNNRRMMRQFVIVRYEDLLNDTVRELDRLMLVLGQTRVNTKTLKRAVESARAN